MDKENRNSGHHHRNNNTAGKINNRSMSDADSQTSQLDEFHSPLRSDSPFRSDDPFPPPPPPPPPGDSRAIVSVGKNRNSPLRKQPPPSKALSPVLAFNRAVREEPATGVHKFGPAGGDGVGEVAAEDGGVGGERRSRPAVNSISRRPRSDVALEKAALGFRVSELILSLISFSVMVSDKTQGWSGDSFDRYKEYRYCVAVNVIAFAYSGFQALSLTYNLIHGRHLSYYLRYHFDFLMDQILAYLLISASSSAATRVDDWVSNWGKDEFTEKASASIGMSFLAFTAFALSSLLSGYNLCTQKSG